MLLSAASLDEKATLERGFYWGFADMGDLKPRWRRIWSSLDQEIAAHAHLIPLITLYDAAEETALPQLQKPTRKSQRPDVDQKRPSLASPVGQLVEKEKDKDYPVIEWPKVRPRFRYTSQDTLFPLSSTLTLPAKGKIPAKLPEEQPKTRKMSGIPEEETASLPVAQPTSDQGEVTKLTQKKPRIKKLTFQESLPTRYDPEDSANEVSTSKKFDSGGNESTEGAANVQRPRGDESGS